MKTIELGKNVNLDMVHIPGGTFTMGSPKDEPGRLSDEGPQHQVTVAEFWMGKYTITLAQWRVVAGMPQVNLSLDRKFLYYLEGDNRPVEQVNWYEAIEFCARLSAHTGQIYTLPSEAQWEYACRAGTTTPFYFGETLTPNLANYHSNGITEVGSFPQNSFGLYDMHGNVWEWCLDHYAYNGYNGAPDDGSAWIDPKAEKNKSCILRGGSWTSDSKDCRCASRVNLNPVDSYLRIGFRVVCPV